MIRTLVWKEYREHRAVWGVMTALGLAVFSLIAVMLRARGGILPTLESVMPVLPAGSIIVASWVALCRDKATQGQRPSLPGWLVAAWILFIAFGVSIYMVESKGHFNSSRAAARDHSVDGAARWLAVWH